jgi:hypothetical protein
VSRPGSHDLWWLRVRLLSPMSIEWAQLKDAELATGTECLISFWALACVPERQFRAVSKGSGGGTPRRLLGTLAALVSCVACFSPSRTSATRRKGATADGTRTETRLRRDACTTSGCKSPSMRASTYCDSLCVRVCMQRRAVLRITATSMSTLVPQSQASIQSTM